MTSEFYVIFNIGYRRFVCYIEKLFGEFEMKLPKCKDIPAQFWYPQGATEQELKVFRLTINNNLVCPDDFLSKYELDKKYGKDTTRLAEDDCYYGLSTLEDFEDAKKLLAKVKAKGNLKGISQGTTIDGLIRKTPSRISNSHVTWWPYAEAKPEAQYVIITGGKENE